MIAGLDSATMPNLAQVRAASAAGVRIWNGYLACRAGVKLANPWTKAAFDAARQCGSIPIAYCSGWDDPAACKIRAEEWNVRLCLDVEGGIRGFGRWTQQWLDRTGAGLYANQATHNACRAPFRILYGTYFNTRGDVYNPNGTWRGTPPSEPHGYQWWNTHTEFGVSVDRGWYDNWFLSAFSGGSGGLGGDDMDATEHEWLRRVDVALFNPPDANDPYAGVVVKLNKKLDDLKAQIAALPAGGAAVDLTAITALVNEIKTDVAGDPTLATKIDALSKHLGVGTP